MVAHTKMQRSTCPAALNVPSWAAGISTLGPALQYIAGELPVRAGDVLPVLASHNTVSATMPLYPESLVFDPHAQGIVHSQ